MKNYRRIKKFGAVAIAIAMIGTLSVGAFADETDAIQDENAVIDEFVVDNTSEDIIVPDFVQDLADEILEEPVETVETFEALGASGGSVEVGNLLDSTQLKITDIEISKTVVKSKQDAYTYSVVLQYEFIAATEGGEVPNVIGKQVAMVGYTFDGTAEDAAVGAVTDSNSVYAIDQVDASKGTFNIKLTSDPDSPKHVSNDAELILKIGSDAVEGGGPQAVAVSLADAVENIEFAAVYAEPSKTTYDSTSTEVEAVKTALASSITATVYDSADKSGNSAAGYATTNWAVKSGESFTGEIGSSCVFEGEVVPDDAAAGKFDAGALKVEVTVTIPALTDGTLTVTPKTVKTGDTYNVGIHELIDSIKIASGSVEDSYAVNAPGVTYEWVDGTALDTSAAGNSAQLKVTVSGESADGKFNITEKSATITITVVAAVTGTYGDVDGLNGVDDMDWMYVLDWTSGGNGFTGLDDPTSRAYKAADVDGENGIDDMDWMYILDWTSGGNGHVNINTSF